MLLRWNKVNLNLCLSSFVRSSTELLKSLNQIKSLLASTKTSSLIALNCLSSCILLELYVDSFDSFYEFFHS